ncbi:MAG: hypothetical protein A2Z47_16000 [Thermodesulfovibrio sp. RBG_19FT_COMBO_42_12]|nr:MAG: hypothetical protein A2Z47_16000 [Thermodesulfovibrio sp. RBG_19FT_COMBO_42_12]
MKVTKICMCGLSWVIIVMLVIPPGIMAQDFGQTEQPAKFKKEELVQMLAPIALYPDSLLAQVLIASTYPIEVVEAERWMKQNKDLKGGELDRSLRGKTWDASVKSLCYFPEVLYAMSGKLDQTTKLGDAFLSQQDDVMDTIQELRSKAQEQGNLETTKEQKVVVEDDVIRIEPADPQVIYVPIYDPFYAYGPWWYPAYPPYYWYYPPGVVITGGYIGFGFGLVVGLGIYSWCWFDWYHHHIYVDMHHTGRFHRFDRRDTGRHPWRHAPIHRKGVAYRDSAISQRFGQSPSRRGVMPEARGYFGLGFDRQTMGTLGGTIERRGTLGTTGGRIEYEKVQSPSSRGNVFSGIGNGSFESKASERGFTSRQGGGFRSIGRGGGFRR